MITHIKLGAVLAVAAAACAQTPHLSSPCPRQAWGSLTCNGVTQTNIGDLNGDLGAKAQTSTDEMKIVRVGHTLHVQLNQIEVAKKLGKNLVSTDIYTITRETAEGLAATNGDSLYPTVHTLVIESSGGYAIWTESTLSWNSATKNPTSFTVLFNCKK